MLKDTVNFSKSVEEMMRQTLGIPLDEPVEEELEYEERDEDEEMLEDDDAGEVEEMHDELWDSSLKTFIKNLALKTFKEIIN